MEFLFAHLLADLARDAALAQAPDNLFVLPENVSAWKRLYKLLQDEHEVASMEISDGKQERSREIRPHFNKMARLFEDKGVPFIRVPISTSFTHRELRNDLGGIEYSPTILNLNFLEDGKLSIQKFEGFQSIVDAFNSGRYRRTMEEWVQQKIKRKIAEKMAEEMASGFVLGALAAKEREEKLKREYEEKLKREREEVRRKEQQLSQERIRHEEEEKRRRENEQKRKREEEERQEEEQKRLENELKEKRARGINKLKAMDLESAPVKEIKSIMQDMEISVVGLLDRSDYLDRLYKRVPELRPSNRSHTSNSTGSSQSSEFNLPMSPSESSLAKRIRNINLSKIAFGELKQLVRDADLDPMAFESRAAMERALRNYASDSASIPSYQGGGGGLEDFQIKYEKTKNENEQLRRELRDKDDKIKEMKDQANKLKMDLDLAQRRAANTSGTPQARSGPLKSPSGEQLFRSPSGGMDADLKDRTKRLEMERMRLANELFDMRLLYSTSLEDYKVLELVSQGDDGVVMKVKCQRTRLTDPNKIFALKGLINYHAAKTVTRARAMFKNEYDILCKLPSHDNIIKLHAFFYDRFEPDIHPALKALPGVRSISLFLVMDFYPNSLEAAVQGFFPRGIPRKQVCQWFLQLLCALEFLHSHNVVHRDLKMGNLLLDGNTLRVADFGVALLLEKQMTMPYIQGMQIPGNLNHKSPEILNARPGPNRLLHYDKHSVWAAGILAYEMAGHISPFTTGEIDQCGYVSSELPRLTHTRGKDIMQAEKLPERLTELVKNMLEFRRETRIDIGAAKLEMHTIMAKNYN